MLNVVAHKFYPRLIFASNAGACTLVDLETLAIVTNIRVGCKWLTRCHYTQQNDIQNNDTQHNDI
jgi:hypothetical protein